MNDKELLFEHFKELLKRSKEEKDAEACISYTECALKVCLMMNQIDNLKAGTADSMVFLPGDGKPIQ